MPGQNTENSELGERSDLSITELRDAAPLLKHDLIRAGDVLLSCGPNPGAKATALATDGAYSHAAIWLPARPFDDLPSHLELAEADPSGVGPTPPNTIMLSLDGRAFESVVPFPGARRLLLLRHPEVARLPPEQILAAAERLRKREFYRAYSKFDRLVDVSFLPPPVRQPFRQVMNLFDRRETVDPGAFCSELVAKFFVELGVPLFENDVEPGLISPSRLAAKDCRLIPAPHIPVIWAEDLGSMARGYQWTFGGANRRLFDRKVALTWQVNQREATKRISMAVDAFNEQLRLAEVEWVEKARVRSIERDERIKAQASPAEPWHPSAVHSSPERLLSRSRALKRLELELAILEAGLLNGDVTPERFALREFASMLDRELTYQANRRYALGTVYALRRLAGGRGKRRKLLLQWADYRRDHFRSTSFFESMAWPRTAEALLAKLEPEPRENVMRMFGRLEAQAGEPWERAWRTRSS